MGLWIWMSPGTCPDAAGSLEVVTRGDSKVLEWGQEEGHGIEDRAR